MKRILGSLFFALPALVLFAQTGGGTSPAAKRDATGFLPVPTESAPAAPTVTPNPVVQAPDPKAAPTAAETPGGSALDDKYKLQVGDVVSFQITEDRSNSIPLLVAESSELEFPYIGRLNVAGKTCRQVADEAKVLLEKDYYYKATVSVALNTKDSRPMGRGRVYVFGYVVQPGPVDIPPNENFTASRAINSRGGFRDFADKKNVKVVRKTAEGIINLPVNMINVMEKGRPQEDITLSPEDYIIVPKSWHN